MVTVQTVTSIIMVTGHTVTCHSVVTGQTVTGIIVVTGQTVTNYSVVPGQTVTDIIVVTGLTVTGYSVVTWADSSRRYCGNRTYSNRADYNRL